MTQIIAQQGDTVDQMCLRFYGVTAGVTEQVLVANPNLGSGPFIAAGTKVTMPTAKVAQQTTVNLWD